MQNFKLIEECECELEEDVICSDCGEHTEYCPDCGTTCCGARKWNTDYEPHND